MQRMTVADIPPGLPDPVADARFYAGVPLRRLAAFCIDAVGAGALGIVGGLALGIATLGIGLLAFGPAMLAAAFAWRFVGLARLSATPGMWAVGIELRRADGARLDPALSALHTALYFGCFFLMVPQIASMAMMATDPRGRGLPDALTGCAAIHRPA